MSIPSAYGFAGSSRQQYFTEPLVKSYVFVLRGRYRYAKAQILYNTRSKTVYNHKKGGDLGHFLVTKFGQDACGVLCDGEVWRDEEEWIHSGLLKSGEVYHVVYEEATPSYQQALSVPPCYPTDALKNPDFAARSINNMTYYQHIPTISRSFKLRFRDGKIRTLVMNNKDVEHIDTLLNFLHEHSFRNSLLSGWCGVMIDGTEYRDDSILYSKASQDEIHDVTYVKPKFNVLRKALDSKMNVVYSLGEETAYNVECEQ